MSRITLCRWIVIAVPTIEFQDSFRDPCLNQFDKFSRCELCHSFAVRPSLLSSSYWLIFFYNNKFFCTHSDSNYNGFIFQASDFLLKYEKAAELLCLSSQITACHPWNTQLILGHLLMKIIELNLFHISFGIRNVSWIPYMF